MALSGCVIALQALIASPATVGVQLSGLVPIVQNTIKRLACLVVAALVLPALSMEMNGASKMPAPALTVNCLRLSLYMRFPVGSLAVVALDEARRVEDGRV